MPILKIGIATQLGYSSVDNIPNWHVHGYRRFWESEEPNSGISGDTRWQAAATAFEAAGVDFSAILGGYVWSTGQVTISDADLISYIAKPPAISVATLTNPVYNVIDIRDTTAWDDSATYAMSDFYDAVGLYPVGHNQGAVENPHPNAANPEYYTSDYKGVRLVFLNTQLIVDTYEMPEAAVAWLEDTALDTDLPVIVLSSAYIAPRSQIAGGVESPGFGTKTGSNNIIGNYQDVRDILTAAGNVVGVIMGNTGWGWWPDSTTLNESPAWSEGNIDYIPLDSMIFAPDAGNNRYYIVEINTEAVALSATQSRGNIKVTSYGVGDRDKAFDDYGVF